MQAGKFRHRITIKHKPAQTEGSYGYVTPSWDNATSDGPFFADVSALTGRELQSMTQRWAEARFSVRMRYQPGVTINREDRILWQRDAGNRTLEVLDAEDPDGRKRQMSLICREFVS